MKKNKLAFLIPIIVIVLLSESCVTPGIRIGGPEPDNPNHHPNPFHPPKPNPETHPFFQHH